MPQIKQVQNTSVRLNPLQVPINNTRIPVVKPNNLTEGLDQVTVALENIGRKVNETSVIEAETEFYKQSDNLLFNSDDAYYKRNGKNAFSTMPGTNDDLEKLREQIEEGLDNEAQKTLFNRSAQKRLLTDRRGIASHAQKQLEVWDDAASAARIVQAKESARSNYSVKSIEDNIIRLQTEVLDQSIKKGVSPEVKQLEVSSQTSKLIRGSIINAIDKHDTGRAKQILKKFDNELREEDKQYVIEKLEISNAKEKAIDNVDNYVGKGLDELGALNDASKIKDDIERVETENRITLQYHRRRQSELQRENNLFQNYGREVMAGNLAISDIPVEAWDSMSLAMKDNLKRIEQESLDRYSDPDLIQQIRDMEGVENWEGIQKLLHSQSSNLSNSDRLALSTSVNNKILSDPLKVSADIVDMVVSKIRTIPNSRATRDELVIATNKFRLSEEKKGNTVTNETLESFVDDQLINNARLNRGLFTFQGDTGLTLPQVAEGVITRNNITNSTKILRMKRKLVSELGIWNAENTSINGIAPSDLDRQRYAETLLFKVATTPDDWFKGNVRIIDMSKEQRKELGVQRLLNYLQSHRTSMTEEEFNNSITKLNTAK